MNTDKQQRLRELALIMLRDAHGEDFTAEQAALLPAQIEEYRRLTEPQEILSLLEARRTDTARSQQGNSLLLGEVLGRYLRDLRLRTFPDNDEGDYSLRWTAGEIQRVERLVAAVREGVAHG